jgi:hypothetical protein
VDDRPQSKQMGPCVSAGEWMPHEKIAEETKPMRTTSPRSDTEGDYQVSQEFAHIKLYHLPQESHPFSSTLNMVPRAATWKKKPSRWGHILIFPIISVATFIIRLQTLQIEKTSIGTTMNNATSPFIYASSDLIAQREY